MKGQAAEHLPGIVKIMADVAAGGNTKKLFKMMEDGQLDPNKYLPLLFEELNARSAGGWNKYTQSIQYQQNMASKRFEDTMKLFGASGGNDAFFRMWKAFADGLPQLDGLVKGLAESFGLLADGVSSVMLTLSGLSQLTASFTESSANTKKVIAGLGTAILAYIFPAAAAVGALYLALNELAAFSTGKESLLGKAAGVDYNDPEAVKRFKHLPFYEKSMGGASAQQGFNQSVNSLFTLPSDAHWERTKALARAAGFVIPAGIEYITGYEDYNTQTAKAYSMRENINASGSMNYLFPNNPRKEWENIAPLKIENVNIHATTNDPTEHAKKFSETLENTLIKFPKKEGN